jgi:hypothetical protein
MLRGTFFLANLLFYSYPQDSCHNQAVTLTTLKGYK